MNAITILESDNSECPVIGTVLCKGHSRENIESRIKEALRSHFDAEILTMEIPWIDIEKFRAEPFDLTVGEDDDRTKQTIEIHQTEIY